ncbi:DNA alkylation repair protein [Calothrix sp. PCC 6303]|uniref:DNA alkylation repair protein n=1 Tax=Calothrix sp. PCC 6303 TaxID=1170562 RepID=UPI0002A01DE7|nr:DNA alkylation repair protein [Calothrix sp. PCC 6303]AFZ01421.1 DNA alkylation repair enzyme [Calothrix sp. PCC 6303]
MAQYLITQLQEQLAQADDSKTKEWWEAYLKHSLPFRGLKLPQVRAILHSWAKTANFSSQPVTQQFDTAIALIQESWGEDKLAGILLLQEFLLKHRLINWESDLPKFATLFDEAYIKEWNTCDWLCVKVLNPLIKQQGKSCAEAIMQWCEAENLWRKRASVVSFVNIAKHGESNFPGFTQMLLHSCGVVVQSSERFAQTGTGWALRELGLSDRNLVIDFIKTNSTYFSSEGLRYGMEKFPPDLQQQLKQYRQEKLKSKNNPKSNISCLP